MITYRKLFTFSLASLMTLFAWQTASAQIKTELSEDLSYRFSTDVDDSDASIEGLRSISEVALSGTSGDSGRYVVSFSYGYYQFDSDNASWIDDVDELNVGLFYTHNFNDEWSGLLQVSSSFARMDGADFGDGDTYDFVAGATYHFSRTLSMSFGGFYFTNLGDDPTIAPFISINWKISDRLMLATANGAFLTYDLTGDGVHWLETSVRYQSLQAAHDMDRLMYGMYAEEEHVIARVGYTWQASDTVSLGGYVEAAFAQSYTFRNDDEVELAEFDTDPSFFAGIKASAVF